MQQRDIWPAPSLPIAAPPWSDHPRPSSPREEETYCHDSKKTVMTLVRETSLWTLCSFALLPW